MKGDEEAHVALLDQLAVDAQRVPEEHEEARAHHADTHAQSAHALVV